MVKHRRRHKHHVPCAVRNGGAHSCEDHLNWKTSCTCTSIDVAVPQGNTEAWFHLGVMHLNGWGTPRDAVQAQYFFSMTAKTVRAFDPLPFVYKYVLLHVF